MDIKVGETLYYRHGNEIKTTTVTKVGRTIVHTADRSKLKETDSGLYYGGWHTYWTAERQEREQTRDELGAIAKVLADRTKELDIERVRQLREEMTQLAEKYRA